MLAVTTGSLLLAALLTAIALAVLVVVRLAESNPGAVAVVVALAFINSNLARVGRQLDRIADLGSRPSPPPDPSGHPARRL